ncbi:MAG TPA: hypothetical protein VGC91_13035 [Pyrinomonadaceae bacterium]
MSLPSAWGLAYSEVQGLARLAYKGHSTEALYHFPNSDSDWRVLHIFEVKSFRAVLVQGSKRVLSLSGTDDAGDWVDNISQTVAGVSWQYHHALKLAKATAPDVVVGHSLGGGMASYIAIYGGRCAATINPAALNVNLFSLLSMFKNGDLVINYIAPGEILSLLPVFCPVLSMMTHTVGRTICVGSNGGFDPIARHGLAELEGFEEPQRK